MDCPVPVPVPSTRAPPRGASKPLSWDSASCAKWVELSLSECKPSSPLRHHKTRLTIEQVGRQVCVTGVWHTTDKTFDDEFLVFALEHFAYASAICHGLCPRFAGTAVVCGSGVALPGTFKFGFADDDGGGDGGAGGKSFRCDMTLHEDIDARKLRVDAVKLCVMCNAVS